MYFVTPSHSVAVNPKVASSTLARAIIAAFHPEQESLLQTAAYPEGKGPHNVQAHWLCPKEMEPTRPVVLVVREPLDRFRSAVAQVGIADIDAAIDALEQDREVQIDRPRKRLRINPHFSHQHELLRGGTAFRLENIEAAATLIGLPLPLPSINEAARPKPDLTPEQASRVLAYYAADAELYAGLA